MVGKVWLARAGVLFLILSISGLAVGQQAKPDHGPEFEPAHPPVAPAIVKALQRHKRSKNISAIGRYTRHRSSNVRLAALDALQHLNSSRVDVILRRMQRDRDSRVRRRSVELLEARRSRRAEKKLLQRLQRRDISAIDPLVRVASPQTAERLLAWNIGNLTKDQRGLMFAKLYCRKDFKLRLRERLFQAVWKWYVARPGKKKSDRLRGFRRIFGCQPFRTLEGQPGDFWAPGEHEKPRPRSDIDLPTQHIGLHPLAPDLTWYQAMHHTFASQWMIAARSKRQLQAAVRHRSSAAVGRKRYLAMPKELIL